MKTDLHTQSYAIKIYLKDFKSPIAGSSSSIVFIESLPFPKTRSVLKFMKPILILKLKFPKTLIRIFLCKELSWSHGYTKRLPLHSKAFWWENWWSQWWHWRQKTLFSQIQRQKSSKYFISFGSQIKKVFQTLQLQIL